MPKYVIIGGSAGAIGAVEAIREVDPRGSIAVVSDEPLSTYSRPMIGEYLSGETPLEDIMYRSRDFWRDQKVEAFVGRRVVGVDLDGKCIKLEGDVKIDFENLLIATGSKPFVAKIDGINKKGVFTFTTLADVEALKESIAAAEKAVVVGGGLIGMCIAEALTKHDIEVTIVELKDKILSLLLDSMASDIVKTKIQNAGVSVITGHSAQQIIGRNDNETEVGAVVLDNGEIIPCDMVVMAIGVRPCTELVFGTKVKTNRGIVVDRFMRTNIPYVYACGDVAEAYDFVSNENMVLPQWPVACSSGKVAGYNMAGKKTQYSGATVMSALKYFGIPIIAVGITDPKDIGGYEALVSYKPKVGSYKKIVIKDGKIAGFILVQDIERAGILFYLMKKGVKVDDFKGKLLAEDFGIVSLPEQTRRILLTEGLKH